MISALHTVTSSGTRLHYAAYGAGDPPVLLLHAFPLEGAMWADQVAALAARHRVVVPDLKGFGASGAPEEPSAYTMENYAEEVAGVLDAAGVDRAVVVGMSMGGYIAFSLLRRHRRRVAALVLADTRADADTPEVRDRRTGQQAQVLREGTAGLVETLLESLLAPGAGRERPEVVARARRLMAGPAAGIVGALEAMKGRPDSTGDLADVDIPTLVVVGEHDGPTPPPVADALHRAVAGSQLVVLAGAGHLSNLEAPDAFNDALCAFVASLPPAG